MLLISRPKSFAALHHSPSLLASGRLGLLVLLLILCIYLSLPVAVAAQQPEGQHTPAFPVPECVNASGAATSCQTTGAIRLWPRDLRPADSGQLPASRDSTRWTGTSRPQVQSNTQLFTGIDIVGDQAYVAYVNGFSIWNLACGELGTPSCPARASTREVFRGQFHHSNAGGEIYLLIWSIDAHRLGSKVYVALPGDAGEIGLSVWDATDPARPRQIYQDWGRDGREVRLLDMGGRLYALYANSSTGLHLYDLTAAIAEPCFENTRRSPSCGVYRGKVGTYDRAVYVDVFTPSNPSGGPVFAYSTSTVNRGGLEVLRLVDPRATPAKTELVLRDDLAGSRVQGIALFEHRQESYLAANVGVRIQISAISRCLRQSCEALPSPVWNARNLSSQRVFLSFSESQTAAGTIPFLYVGGNDSNLSGSRREQLFDLSSLTPSPPNDGIFAVTDGGGSYTDSGNGLTVDYWGRYYPGNAYGFSFVAPRHGKFYKHFFLRSAYTIFDVHRHVANAETFDGR